MMARWRPLPLLLLILCHSSSAWLRTSVSSSAARSRWAGPVSSRQDSRGDAAGRSQQHLLTCEGFSTETLRRLNEMLSKIEAGAKDQPLAALDADGTLWETDACVEYMEFMDATRGWGHIDTVQTYESLLQAVGKDRAYGYCAQIFAGLPLDVIERTCAESYESNVRASVFPEMRHLVGLLKARGWQVSIVTASPAWVIVPGAQDLGLEAGDVIGIEVEVARGRATDVLRYPLSYGSGKPTRLRMVHPRPRPLCLAAGNSGDDFDLLHEVWEGGVSLFIDSRAIGGTSGLVAEALQRDWIVHTPQRARGRAHRP